VTPNVFFVKERRLYQGRDSSGCHRRAS